MPIQTTLLLTNPEHTAQIAAWEHEAWHFLTPAETVEGAYERLVVQTPNALPLTIIALEMGAGHDLLGCVTLDQADLPGHNDLTPWLASLYVPPAHRGFGVGRCLADAVGELAKARGHSKLYLYTWEHEARYTRWGFQTFRTSYFADHEIVVMARAL